GRQQVEFVNRILEDLCIEVIATQDHRRLIIIFLQNPGVNASEDKPEDHYTDEKNAILMELVAQTGDSGDDGAAKIGKAPADPPEKLSEIDFVSTGGSLLLLFHCLFNNRSCNL